MTQPEVLYHDDDVLVVAKPAGLLSLADGYQPHLPYVRALLEPDWGPVWPVYTLDKEASGVLVLARNREALKALQEQWQQGGLTCLFHALVRGQPEWREYTARHPLRTNVGRRKRTVVDPKRGRPAETRFRVLEPFGRYTLLEALPRTWHRHQIRAHLYALGHPVAADPLYGPGRLPEDPIDRLALHARRVVFTHPHEGREIHITCEHPRDWQQALEALRMEQLWVDQEVEEETP